jgi:hypothetical protein
LQYFTVFGKGGQNSWKCVFLKKKIQYQFFVNLKFLALSAVLINLMKKLLFVNFFQFNALLQGFDPHFLSS